MYTVLIYYYIILYIYIHGSSIVNVEWSLQHQQLFHHGHLRPAFFCMTMENPPGNAGRPKMDGFADGLQLIFNEALPDTAFTLVAPNSIW